MPSRHCRTVLSLFAKICLLFATGASQCFALEPHDRKSCTALVSSLVSANEAERLAAARSLAKSYFLFAEDPRSIEYARANKFNGLLISELAAILRDVATEANESLITAYDRSDDAAGIYAGALLAATCNNQNRRAIAIFRKHAWGEAASIDCRLVGYAGLLVGETQDVTVLLPTLRAWSTLSAAARAEIWWKLGHGLLSEPDGPKHDLSSILQIGSTNATFEDVSAGLAVVDQAAASEAATLVEMGRGWVEAPGLLRATMDDLPIDVRVFALRCLSNRRIGNSVLSRIAIVRRHLQDSSLSVRCAAVQTLIALNLSEASDAEIDKMVTVIGPRKLKDSERLLLASLLRNSREDADGMTNMDDLSEDQIPDVFFRSDSEWLGQFKFAMENGNPGQRRLAVARALDKVFSRRRKAPFITSLLGVFREQQRREHERSVLAEIDNAIQVAEPFVNRSP